MTLCQGQRRYPRMTSSLYFPITEKDVCISSPARPAAIPPSLRRKFSAVTGAVSGGTTMLRRESPCIVRCVDVAFGEWPTVFGDPKTSRRSEEHTSELQSLMRISYAVSCLNKAHTQCYHPHCKS